jgi:hypothetical protein
MPRSPTSPCCQGHSWGASAADVGFRWAQCRRLDDLAPGPRRTWPSRSPPLDAGLAVEAAPLTPTWPWHATAVGRARLGPRARRRPPLGEHARPPPGEGGVSGRRARGAAPWRSPSSRPSRTPRRRKGVPDESGTEADEGFPAPGRTGGKSQPWKPPGPQSGTKCGTKSEGSLKTLGTKGQ